MSELTILGLAVVATFAVLYHRTILAWISQLRSASPPAPAVKPAEVIVDDSGCAIGILEQGRMANAIHKRVFKEVKEYVAEYDENTKACDEVRKQMTLPLEGAK